MRVLITGSSGQTGTNLALRLLADGHTVFGVDRRVNGWTDAFPTLLQDLAVPQREFRGGIGGAPYPPCDIVVHLAANAKVYELVEQPHRALENINITFNVLEYCRAAGLPLIFSSSREVYGDIHRYITEERSADFSFTESPYSASKISHICSGVTSPPESSVCCWTTPLNSICSLRGRSNWCSAFMM